MAQITMIDTLNHEASFLNVEDTPMPEVTDFICAVKRALKDAGHTHMEISCEFTAEEQIREEQRVPCPHYDS